MTPSPALHFATSPRYREIASIFAKIRDNAPPDEVWSHASKIMQQLSGPERDAMPEFIKQELRRVGS